MSSEEQETHEALYRIPKDGLWNKAWMISGAVALLGLIVSAAGYSTDPERFAYAWLFAFMSFLTISLGGIFFVVISYITSAAWSVTVRRTAETLAVAVPVFLLLFVPIWMNAETLYEWSTPGEHHASAESMIGASVAQAQEHGPADGPGHAAAEGNLAHGSETDHGADGADHKSAQEHKLHSDLLEHKKPYLNAGSWSARAILYFLLWFAVAFFYYRTSVKQDESKDPALTARMQSWAPVSMIVFAFTLTFASFDWMMALEPTWYSTIYGVYVFSGAVITIYAVVILLTLGLKSQGHLGEAVNTEHYHDLAKLMFGFVVFWAYIGFSQMMLQWYAGIPEEIVYYEMRWHAPGWKAISLFLFAAHFVLPLLFLISRNIKRRLPVLAFACVWMIAVHILDLYWFVMPNAPASGAPWIDVGAVLAVGGVYFTTVFLLMRRHALIPLGDPRLPRSLHHVNA